MKSGNCPKKCSKVRKLRDILTLLKRKKVFQTLIWQILFGVNVSLIKRVIPRNFDIVATGGAYYSTTTWKFGNRWFSELHWSLYKWFLAKLVGVLILVLVPWGFAKKWVWVCCETVFVMSGSEYFHDFPRKNNNLGYKIIFFRIFSGLRSQNKLFFLHLSTITPC